MPDVDLELKYSSSRTRPGRPRHRRHAEEGETAPSVDAGIGAGISGDTVDVQALQKRLEDLTQSEKVKDSKIEKLAAQFLDAQSELDRARWAREQEAAETAKKFSQLEHELGTVSNSLSGARKMGRRAIVAFAAIVMLAASMILWRLWANASVQPQSVADTPIALQRDLVPRRAIAAANHPLHRSPSQLDKLPPGAAFTAALDRLDEAFSEFPDRSPEDLLRAASGPKAGCKVQWSDKLPSLLFGDMNAGPNVLAATLYHCAEAISRLH
jgi:hypothetical protein